VRRQKEDPYAWIGGQDVAARVDASAVRKPEVHQYHVGAVECRSFHRLRNAACLGNDLDGFRLLEKRPQAQPDDFVVVDEHQSYRGRHRTPLSGLAELHDDSRSFVQH
jgi:hypothetical protein